MITFDQYKDMSNIKWGICRRYVPVPMDDFKWAMFFKEISETAEKIKKDLGEDAYHFFLTEMTGTIQGMQQDRCENTEDIQKKKQTSLDLIIKECLTKK